MGFAIVRLGLDDDMLVIAGDNVLDFSLTRFIAYAKEKNSSGIMRYYEPEDRKLLKCGVVVDAEDKILNMEEKPAKPASHWCCPPFYYYIRADTKLVEKGTESDCGVDAPGSYAA